MNNYAENVQRINKFPIVAVLLAGAFLGILNQTLLVTAIPPIMSDFGLTENTAQWLTTIFMLVNGIMIPITAFLVETFTTRHLFLTAMGVFAAGTLFCVLAPDFPLLITGRIIQAAGAGVVMPLMMTVLLLIFPAEKRGTVMGTVGLVIAFAPAIGPSLSGWLIEHFHWKALFYIVLPLVLIDIIVAYFVMKNVTTQKFPKLDVTSIILSTIGFGGILYGFSSAGNNGWNDIVVIITLIVGAVTLTAFIMRQFKLKEPILEFRVFQNKTFTISTVITMIAFMGLIGAENLLPLYMQNMAGYTALESGLMILPGAMVMGIMSPITGRIFDKIGARWLAIIGLSIVTVTTLFYTQLTTETSFTYLTVVFAIRMFGLSMVTMPVTTAGLNQLPDSLIPHGTAMNNTMRQVAASIGTAMLITIMTSAALGTDKAADPTALVRGVNVAFFVTSAITVVGLILAFAIKETTSDGERAARTAEEGEQ